MGGCLRKSSFDQKSSFPLNVLKRSEALGAFVGVRRPSTPSSVQRLRLANACAPAMAKIWTGEQSAARRRNAPYGRLSELAIGVGSNTLSFTRAVHFHEVTK